jgi:hypothetical protein
MMTDPSDNETASNGQSPPRTIADFGGRRKIFDRRLHQAPIDHPDRRSGKDHRSGFDRRSLSDKQTENITEKRAFPPPSPDEV